VDSLSFKTKSTKSSEVVRSWFVVDAEGKTVGRLSTQIAATLMGKRKPSYTPNTDTGDYVIIVNADKVKFTGNKINQKLYTRHSLYPGGQTRTVAKDQMTKKPTSILELSVKGMLPKTKLGRAMYKKLFVYAGSEHPHTAQKPEPFKI
jgi:large subunit ribosomal protein L13